ncbi:hypothetical protein SAMN06298226_1574 [Nitrosovibrio sp. Nv4]|nr:hypothetical protein SAMN06298226_1574 [Nitrosovibrio sp. Nv4]
MQHGKVEKGWAGAAVKVSPKLLYAVIDCFNVFNVARKSGHRMSPAVGRLTKGSRRLYSRLRPEREFRNVPVSDKIPG